MSEVRNLAFAVVASVIIMIGWKFIYERFFVSEHILHREISTQSLIPEISEEHSEDHRTREEAVALSPRTKFGNGNVAGSVSLRGGLIDDVSLVRYRETLDQNSGQVVLLSPNETEEDAIVEFGWVHGKDKVKVPNKDSLWELEGSDTNNQKYISLRWNNEEGIVFRLKISLDDGYMFTVHQVVENNTDSEVHLAPYARINRQHNSSASKSHWISHEGALGSFGGGLKEWTYKGLVKENSVSISGQSSDGKAAWIGLGDKYWFSALVAAGKGKVNFRAKYVPRGNSDRFQVDFSRPRSRVLPHHSESTVTHLFVGAKELRLLDMYKDKLGISLFDKAVDFGLLYFITKPVFLLLQYFYKIMGNFGMAILMLTISIKLMAFPLSSKSYISMFKLKQLQPEISRLKELYKADNAKVSKEIASLFRKHKVSPISGFLPLLVQIPVFFALYKVLFVTIEMRHAPFFLWIKDLSSPDSANIVNLFGLLPFQPSICIGVLPAILGLTMVMQQKLNQQYDQVQQDPYNVMKFLPYVFVFVFSSFPAGLVLYWICSNVITMVQQVIIRWHVFGRGGLVSNSA